MKVAQCFQLLLVVVLFSASHQLQFVKKMGPYDVIMTYISNCISPEEEGKLYFDVQTFFVRDESNGGRKQLFKGSIHFPWTKEEYYKLAIENKFYQRKNNDFLLMYTYRGNMCESIAATVPELYKNALTVLGAEEDVCWVPPGNYSWDEWDPRVVMPTPMLEYGEFKVIMEASLDGVVTGCAEAQAEIVPKS